MQRTSFSDMRCSIARSLEVVGEWWTPLIIRDVFLGRRRFNDISDSLGISRNLLTQRLEGLVAHGILERRPYQERPPRYEYHLTQKGQELVTALMALLAWGDRWVAPPEGPPVQLVHQVCGHEFTPQVACSHCGRPIAPGTVTPRHGPGAARPAEEPDLRD